LRPFGFVCLGESPPLLALPAGPDLLEREVPALLAFRAGRGDDFPLSFFAAGFPVFFFFKAAFLTFFFAVGFLVFFFTAVLLALLVAPEEAFLLDFSRDLWFLDLPEEALLFRFKPVSSSQPIITLSTG
jgi:hypothetical protein